MSRTRFSSRTTKLTIMALGPVLAVSLAACGGSSSTTGAAAGATPNASATGAPGGGRGGMGGADFAKIQACLKAAGIAVPTATGSRAPRPSGSFTPNGTPPSNGVRPSGGAGQGGGRGGFGGGMFNSPEAQAALKACGITVPTGGARPNGTATATATSA